MEKTFYKQVYDLIPGDLLSYPVWWYPVDDSVLDEATVRPLKDLYPIEQDYPIIVKTKFRDNRGVSFDGFIEWVPFADRGVREVKPNLLSEQVNIDFWFGIIPPDQKSINKIKNLFPKESWPIKFESEEHFGLKSIKGSLEGLYYLGEDNKVCCQKVWEDS